MTLLLLSHTHLQTRDVSMQTESSKSVGLCEEVRQLQDGRNKGQRKSTQLKVVTNKVTIKLYTLRAFMKERVMSNLNSTLVITVE